MKQTTLLVAVLLSLLVAGVSSAQEMRVIDVRAEEETFTAPLWGTDVPMSPGEPVGRPALIALPGGTAYAAIPDTSYPGTVFLRVVRSTDYGRTWGVVWSVGSTPKFIVSKCKLVRSGLDSVYLVWQDNTYLTIWNIATPNLVGFDSSNVRDFDVAASSTGALYLFVDFTNNSQLRRYGSTDGGRTWAQVGLVSSNGCWPQLYMSGSADSLILCCYAPILADTLRSNILLIRYRQSSNGFLSVIDFKDIVTGVDTLKREVRPVMYRDNVWVFYCIGPQGAIDIWGRASTDRGVTFGAPFPVANSPTFDEYWLDAKHYAYGSSYGADVIYYADSLSGAWDNTTDKMMYLYSYAPTSFTTPRQFSEHPPLWSPRGYIPTLAEFNDATFDAGAIWVGGDPASPLLRLYYDRFRAESVTLLSPKGGETLLAGCEFIIQWSNDGYSWSDSVKLDLSTDNGSNWSPIATVPNYGYHYWVVPYTPTTQGLVRVTWADSTDITDQSDGPFRICLPEAGTWEKVGWAMGQIYSVAYDRYYGQLYAASYTQGMYRSPDRGTSWGPISTGLSNTTLQAMALCEGAPGYLYCGTSVNGVGRGVYKSNSFGASWTLVTNGLADSAQGIQTIAVSPTDPNVVYIGVFSGSADSPNGVWKTTDGGANWFVANTGFGVNKNVLCIAINPLNPSTVYAGTSHMVSVAGEHGRIYKSTDAGGTWVDVSSGLPDHYHPVRALSVCAADTNLILAGLLMSDSLGGPYLSTNGGASWTQITGGMPRVTNLHTRSVAIKPNSTTEFYAGLGTLSGYEAGVWRTTNAGQTWQPFNNGAMQGTYTVRGLAFDPFRGTLFAGGATTDTAGQGMFRHQFVPTGVQEGGQVIPSSFALHQNYPNPFNPTTAVSYQLPVASDVKLIVFDLLGREVATLVNEWSTPGTYTVRFDASNLATGVYFYRLQAGTFVQTQKMLFIK